MTDMMMLEPPLGLRRRRRAAEEADDENRINPVVVVENEEQPEPESDDTSTEEDLPQRQRRARRRESDTRGEWRFSHVYCLVSTFLVILAICLAPSTDPLYAGSNQTNGSISHHSALLDNRSSWTSVEQVAKAAAAGVAAKHRKDDPQARDLLQAIQLWWNQHQQQEQPHQKQESLQSLQSTASSSDGSSGPTGDHTKESRHKSSSVLWWLRPHHRHHNVDEEERQAATATSSTHPVWKWIDPAVLHPTPNSATILIDKVLTSTPRLLAIANLLLAFTYLLHAAVASWFLTSGGQANANDDESNSRTTPPPVDGWAGGARDRMGGFLVFKLLLISAVVAPDTLDLLILLTWYTILSCLRSLDHLAHATTTHLSALGQPPRPGVVQLLFLVLFCNILAAACCVALFHTAGYGMVLLLTCDCALLAADILEHILKHFQCVLEDKHSEEIQVLEARQLQLHTQHNDSEREPSPVVATAEEEPDDTWIHDESNVLAGDDILVSSSRNTIDVRNMSNTEVFQESRRLDRRMEVLDLAHSRRLAILDSAMFALELICHLLTVAHFCHIWSLHGVQFTLIDGVLALHLHSAISSACRKIAQRRNLHTIARDLHDMFPNASDQELRKASFAGDVCCICLGTMTTGGHVKKVHCGHLYHTHCLREVVERAQSIQAAKCPLCRASVLDGRRPSDEAERTVPAPAVGPGGNAGNEGNAQPAAAGGERALFRFSTDGMFPAWVPVPSLSFEVVRRASGPVPQQQPVAAAQQPPQQQPVAVLQQPQQPQPPQPQAEAVAENADPARAAPPPQPQEPQLQQPQSLLRRILVLAGAVPMSPEEEAYALSQLVDMFPQYDRSDLLRELRERGSSEAVAEAILMGIFSGVARGDG